MKRLTKLASGTHPYPAHRRRPGRQRYNPRTTVRVYRTFDRDGQPIEWKVT